MRQVKPVPVQALGIILDRSPEEVSPDKWTAGQNVAFADGAAYRVGGYARYADPISVTTPIFAMNVLVGPESYWIYCGTTSVYVTDGVTHYNITPPAPSQCQAGDWNGCILNGIPVLNNGIDPPFYWNLNTGTPCARLPGWPAGAKCKVIRATKYHLMALNITEGSTNYGSQVWWSNGAQAGSLPTEWTPTASNDAGDVVCGDSPGVILDGLPLRDMFIVYKGFSTYVMQYVAGQYVFTTRKLFDNLGVQTANCAIEVGGMHYVFSGTDVVKHDGQSWASVADEQVKRTLIKSINPARLKLCCVTARILNDQLWVCIPEAAALYLTKAYVFDMVNGDWGLRDLPNVATVNRGIVGDTGAGNSYDSDPNSFDSDITFFDQQSYSPTQDSIIMTDPTLARLYNVDITDMADGAPVFAFLERVGAQVGDYAMHKVVTGIVPRIEGTPGEVLTFRLGGQEWFDKPVVWSDPVDFVIGTDYKVDSIVEGRLLSIRIQGTTAGAWKLYRYGLLFEHVGGY